MDDARRSGARGRARTAGRAGKKAAHRLYAQLAWPTLGGLPLLDERRGATLERELIALCRRLDAEPLEVEVSPDRVRLLARFGPGIAVGDLARRLKDASGAAMLRWGWPARWGRGFAACTVGPSQVHQLVRRLRSGRRARAAAAASGPAAFPADSGLSGPPPARTRTRAGTGRPRSRPG